MMMQVINELDSDNFVLYAFRHYNNPQCVDLDEFYEDLNRFKYLKKLINKYLEHGVLAERLILNHLIILYNVFGIKAATKMLEYKMLKKHWPVLKPFLLFLNYTTQSYKVGIELDKTAIEALRKIRGNDG